MPLYNVFIKSVKDRVKFAQAIRAYQPTMGLAQAMTATRAVILAKNISDADYLLNLVGDSAELHVETKLSPEEVEQEKVAFHLAEAKRWYAELSDHDKMMVDTLVRANIPSA